MSPSRNKTGWILAALLAACAGERGAHKGDGAESRSVRAECTADTACSANALCEGLRCVEIGPFTAACFGLTVPFEAGASALGPPARPAVDRLARCLRAGQQPVVLLEDRVAPRRGAPAAKEPAAKEPAAKEPAAKERAAKERAAKELAPAPSGAAPPTKEDALVASAELGDARATAVAAELERLGVPPEQRRRASFTTGYEIACPQGRDGCSARRIEWTRETLEAARQAPERM